MVAWARAGRTAASPSRLALSRHRSAACGLDCLSTARQMARKRSRFKVSGTAPLATDEPKQTSRMLWRRYGVFRSGGDCAILPECPSTALPHATALHSANCRTISTSFRVLGRASDDLSNATLRHGASWTIGPPACRSRTPSSTYSRHGSATSSMNCSGRADDLRRQSR
jgi:hypothetical protein